MIRDPDRNTPTKERYERAGRFPYHVGKSEHGWYAVRRFSTRNPLLIASGLATADAAMRQIELCNSRVVID